MDGLVVQSRARAPRGGRCSGEPVEHPNGVLAVIARERHELIQDPTFLIRRNGPVPLADRLHQLLPSRRTDLRHRASFGSPTGSKLFEATILAE